MIRVSLLVLLGIASFAAVYVATEPREPSPESPQPAATADATAQTDDAAADKAPADKAPADEAPAETTSIDGTGETQPHMTFELRPTAPAPETAQDTQKQQKAPEPQQKTAAATVRDVTPPNMTAAPQVTAPLTRVKPDKSSAPKKTAHTARLFNPVVVAAGTFKADGGDVHLAGVTAPDPDAQCGKGATAWPCGRMARAALRRFVRGRAIECDLPPGAKDVPDPATCRVGGEDIAQWLVASGWAKRADDHYGKQEDAAKKAKLGLWSPERPDDQAEVAAGG